MWVLNNLWRTLGRKGRAGVVQEEGGREVSEAPIIGWCNVGQQTTTQSNSNNIKLTSRIWIGSIGVFCLIRIGLLS